MEDWFQILRPAFPPLNVVEQRVSLQIYRLHCRGHPVSRKMLSKRLAMPIEVLQDLLNRCPLTHFDNQDQIIAYQGLTLQATNHRFTIEGRTLLHVWCAWDTLFLPENLKTNVRVDSICPTTRPPIHLNLSPQRVEQIEPGETVISFVSSFSAPQLSKLSLTGIYKSIGPRQPGGAPGLALASGVERTPAPGKASEAGRRPAGNPPAWCRACHDRRQ